jgi:hypothetical protein
LVLRAVVSENEISFGSRNHSANDRHVSAGGLAAAIPCGRIFEHQAFADAHTKPLRGKQESLRVWFAASRRLRR